LSDGQRVQQAEASAADIKRAAGFASEELGVKLRCERRIAAMRFAGGDDPVEFLGTASRVAERLLRGPRTKREFIFVLRNISK
jgi:hypothetical protein